MAKQVLLHFLFPVLLFGIYTLSLMQTPKNEWPEHFDVPQAVVPPVVRNGFIRRSRDIGVTSARAGDKPRVIVIYDGTLQRVVAGVPASTNRTIDRISHGHQAKTPFHYLKPYEKQYFRQCSYMVDWQRKFRSVCNDFHELDMILNEDFSILSMTGSWRSTWKAGRENAALKTLQLNRNFDQQSYSFHQTDAMAMERLHSSKFVVDIYGFCGQSVLVEYAPQKARIAIKDEKLSSLERLRFARDLARGLNHIHSIDYEAGRNATFVHNDINIANLVKVGKTLKYNDFNLGVMLKWNKTEPCGFPVSWNGELWRSPEELLNETYVSHMIDIYSLGNVLFQVMTKHQPWTHLEPDGRPTLAEVARRKIQGLMPHFPDKIVESQKLAQQVMYLGILACYRLDPTKRPSAARLHRGFARAVEWVQQKVSNRSTHQLEQLFN